MRRNHIAACLFVAAFSGIVLAAPANADVVAFSNLDGTTVDADALGTYGPIAGSFSATASGTALTQVSLKLSGKADTGSLTVQLLSDASTSPGSVLNTIGVLNDSALSSALSNYTLILATPFELSAGTRYWIALTANDSSASWAWSEDISGPGVAGEYISNANGTFANSTEAPYQMEILTSTPEPSTYALFGLGLLGVAAIGSKFRT